MGNDTSKEKTQDEYITFETIHKYIGITDKKLFKNYLHEVFIDLSLNDPTTKKKYFNKVIFYDYMKLPIFISEKLFDSFDSNSDNKLKENEFVNGLTKLYLGDFNETSFVIFNLLDFDKDNLIQKNDVKLILSYLPLKIEKDSIEKQEEIQIKSSFEIEEIINKTFSKYNGVLNFKQFVDVVTTKQSDVYLQIICYLYQMKPFTQENVERIRDKKKNKTEIEDDEYKDLRVKDNSNNNENIIFKFPNRKSSLSPAEDFISQKTNIEKLSLDNDKKKKNISPYAQVDMLRFANENIVTSNNNNNTTFNSINVSKNTTLLGNNIQNRCSDFNNINYEEYLKYSRQSFISPSKYLQEQNMSKHHFGLITKQLLNPINEEKENNINNEIVNLNDENTSGSSNDSINYNLNQNKNITYENWVYKISENKNIKKFYLVLINKDIFYYKDKEKDNFLGMHNLSGCIITEAQEENYTIINDQKLYYFSITFSNKSKIRTFYTLEYNISKKFTDTLKKGIGYLKFTDYYEIKQNIGKGKFGLVNLGIHKKTNMKVAIKIINKSSIKTQEDNQLVRSEIDIMKLCHHPNIVKLLDHFENSEFIFIVMEYIEGGTLNQYLKKKNFNFSERQIAILINQIGNGLKYLHKYGIIHRDLKPDNIMLTEQSDKGIIKIMDFGLSKIAGYNEGLIDGYGTLSYVAPEVLLRIPYNKEVDIWSMGIILYYMLCGKFPFYGSDEEIIAKRICYGDLEFDDENWEIRSKKVIDLIEKVLVKDPSKRISIDEFLNHSWFKKNMKQKMSM